MAIQHFDVFCKQFQVLLEQKLDLPQFLEKGQLLLGQLVSNPDWFRPTLSGLILDTAFLRAQGQSIDPNEIQLYLSSDKSFSLRAFIWDPGVVYPIHDHGAWGLVGTHINQIGEKKFVRLDDGSQANHAEIEQIADAVLSPGETSFVLPMNDGIHQMRAINETAVSIHVYGKPIRKGFINCFDPKSNTVAMAYSPGTYKKILAIKALGSIPQTWAEEVLTTALHAAEPDFILQECQNSLDKILEK